MSTIFLVSVIYFISACALSTSKSKNSPETNYEFVGLIRSFEDCNGAWISDNHFLTLIQCIALNVDPKTIPLYGGGAYTNESFELQKENSYKIRRIYSRLTKENVANKYLAILKLDSSAGEVIMIKNETLKPNHKNCQVVAIIKSEHSQKASWFTSPTEMIDPVYCSRRSTTTMYKDNLCSKFREEIPCNFPSGGLLICDEQLVGLVVDTDLPNCAAGGMKRMFAYINVMDARDLINRIVVYNESLETMPLLRRVEIESRNQRDSNDNDQKSDATFLKTALALIFGLLLMFFLSIFGMVVRLLCKTEPSNPKLWPSRDD